jgi:hypothetical protein
MENYDVGDLVIDASGNIGLVVEIMRDPDGHVDLVYTLEDSRRFCYAGPYPDLFLRRTR